MKFNEILKWAELCEELNCSEEIKQKRAKSRALALKKLQKQYYIEKLPNEWGKYIIYGIGPTPVTPKIYKYQTIQPNQTYGLLTTIEYIGDTEQDKYAHLWECQCECGNIVLVKAASLIRGHIKSCGCLSKRNHRPKKPTPTFEENPELFIKQQRQAMAPALRYYILKRDNFHCQYCGRGIEDGVKLNVDHIIPVSKGGKTEEDNLQTLCWECNIGKGSDI